MWAKTWRKPTTASHRRLWARLCWFPLHGPWMNTPILWAVLQLYVKYFILRRSSPNALNTYDTITHYWPVCTQWGCWRPVWPLRWPWRSFVVRVHQSHPSPSSTSRSHWLTPAVWHRKIFGLMSQYAIYRQNILVINTIFNIINMLLLHHDSSDEPVFT